MSSSNWCIMTTGTSYLLDASIHFMTMCTFLDILSCTTRWRGDLDLDKICTGKLPDAVTLLPQHEHLVWGKLSSKAPLSPDSMIMKLCTSKSRPWYICVGRVITVGALHQNQSPRSTQMFLIYNIVLLWKIWASSRAPVRWRTGSQNRSLGQPPLILTSKTGSLTWVSSTLTWNHAIPQPPR